MTFNAYNVDHGVAVGATGGTSFYLHLDEDHKFYFAVISKIQLHAGLDAKPGLGAHQPTGRTLQGWCC